VGLDECFGVNLGETLFGNDRVGFKAVTNRLIQITREFKTQLSIYSVAIRHPRTPRLARWLLVAAIAYLASPIDLIPDLRGALFRNERFLYLAGLPTTRGSLFVRLSVCCSRRSIPPLLARIHAEEKLLRSQFGDEYDVYCARTSRLIPGIY
jgi:protein-S-isoprenylcysteine O-methyltransferase Ste14